MKTKLKRGDFVAIPGPGEETRLGVYQREEDGRHIVKDQATGNMVKMRTAPAGAKAPKGQPAYDELQGQIAALEADKEGLLGDLAARDKEIRDLNAEITTNGEQLKARGQRIEALQAELATSGKHIKELEAEKAAREAPPTTTGGPKDNKDK